MKPWIALALLSALCAGVTGILAKKGLAGVGFETGLAIRTALIFAVVMLFWLAMGKANDLRQVPVHAWWWLIASGLTGAASWLCYFWALQDGDVSTVSIIDKSSLPVAVILAFIVLGEKPTINTVVGALTVITGLLIALRK
jgi:transporter family protein